MNKINKSKNEKIKHGIKINSSQFGLHLFQVFLVGLTIGMTRVVIPGLAETEFGLKGGSLFLLASFVMVFGIVKAVMNLLAGKLSDIYGRRLILIWGWLLALPIPIILYYAPTWNWIIVATVFLGLNQGLCWSMALNSKLDLAKSTQKGFVNGLNEFAGYVAVGIAGLVTAYFVTWFGSRAGLLYFSTVVISLGLIMAIFSIKETTPWSKLHNELDKKNTTRATKAENKTLVQLFKLT